jgi:structural maintenance of chromosome 1
MDVDEDENGTQRPRKVRDFGIEVDFSSLDDDEREVSKAKRVNRYKNQFLDFRMDQRMQLPNSTML